MPLFTEKEIVDCLRRHASDIMFSTKTKTDSRQALDHFFDNGGYEILYALGQIHKQGIATTQAVSDVFLAITMVERLVEILINEKTKARLG